MELTATVPVRVKMRIDDLNRQLAQHNDVLNGPQVLHVILDSFEYDDGMANARSAQDLVSLQWLGDDVHQKTLFYNTYLELTRNMKHAYFSEEGLRDILATQMKKSKDL